MKTGLGAALLLATLLPPTAAQAERVVALSPHLTELVCAAGACAQLVATVQHSDYPEPVRRLPKVGDAFTLNAEALLALRPDLVVTWDGGTPVSTLAQLERLELDTLPLRVRSLDDIAEALLRLGERLSTQTAAHAAAHEYRARIAALRARYRDARRLRVFYQIQADPIFTINRDSPISEALRLCGGDNVFADLPQLAGALGAEAVLAADPEVVVWGRQDDSQRIRAFWQRWPQARATRSGRLYEVDADLLARATPRMALGIEQLCAVLDRAR